MGYCYCQWLAVIMKAHSFSCSENFPCMPASMWGIFLPMRFLFLLVRVHVSGAFLYGKCVGKGWRPNHPRL